MNRSMLLVMDMINDLTHEDGPSAETYVPVLQRRQVLERTAAAIDTARAAGARVGFVRIGFSPDYREAPVSSPIFSAAVHGKHFVLGSWGGELHPSLRRIPDDLDVVKHRVGPFYGTPLELVLRSRGIERLYLAGVSTNGVVQAGAREGHDRDFQCVVLSDCCACITHLEHEAALTCSSRFATISESTEVDFR